MKGKSPKIHVKIIRTFGTHLTVARNSVEVKILLFQLGALVSNSVRMKCKVSRDSVEVKILLFQLGARVSNSVRTRLNTQLLTQTPN